jgi:hypothetical protein
MSVGVGGGISLVNQSDALITNNFIVGNSAIYGGGIAWLVPFGPPGPTVVNRRSPATELFAARRCSPTGSMPRRS